MVTSGDAVPRELELTALAQSFQVSAHPKLGLSETGLARPRVNAELTTLRKSCPFRVVVSCPVFDRA